ncbi:unnamed protein product, partial [Staurois parvus]
GQLRRSGSGYLSNSGTRSLSLPPQRSTVSGHPLHCLQSLVICNMSLVFSLCSGLCPQSLVIPCTVSAVSGHLLYCVRSLWSSPVLCPQSLVVSCTVSAVSGPSPVLCPQSLVHLLYCVHSLWSISCTVSAVSGHLLYCVLSLWSSPVLCAQSLVCSHPPNGFQNS